MDRRVSYSEDECCWVLVVFHGYHNGYIRFRSTPPEAEFTHEYVPLPFGSEELKKYPIHKLHDFPPHRYLCFLPKHIVCTWLLRSCIPSNVRFLLTKRSVDGESQNYFGFLGCLQPGDFYYDCIDPNTRIEFVE